MFTSEQYVSQQAQGSSLSPKRSQDLIVDTGKSTGGGFDERSRITPFRTDAKQYMDKVLNLMTIINQVDDLTNVAELKNKLQMQKLQVIKARAERDEKISDLQKQAQQSLIMQSEYQLFKN